MFVVLLTYTQALAEVDKHTAAHREYLEEQYALGHFLISGPKQPRNGGVILARATSVQALEAILAKDPFAINAVAEYEIIAFTARLAAPGLEQLIGA